MYKFMRIGIVIGELLRPRVGRKARISGTVEEIL
jgi:hypothetical protein